MKITVESVEAAVPVTIVRLDGDLDARSYEELIEAGRAAIAAGASRLLIDLRAVPYMGSSGLVALHSITLMLAGETPADTESGWDAHHQMARSVEGGMQDRLRLCAAQPAVLRVLERTGMTRFIAVHEDEADALAAFS
jgi:anti-anti-sigma regulatory factor